MSVEDNCKILLDVYSSLSMESIFKKVKDEKVSQKIIFNVGIFCLRSLLSEIRPITTESYGIAIKDSELGIKVNRKGLIADNSERLGFKKPDFYIEFLFDCYTDFIGTGMKWLDNEIQSELKIIFFDEKKNLKRPDFKDVEIDGYEYYANNIIPFYLDPEKHVFVPQYFLN